MEADILKGDSDRKRGDRQEGQLDDTTIKGVLNILLASNVLRDCGGACTHEQCHLCARYFSRTTRQPHIRVQKIQVQLLCSFALSNVDAILFAK